jgi:hypothetical protein
MFSPGTASSCRRKIPLRTRFFSSACCSVRKGASLRSIARVVCIARIPFLVRYEIASIHAAFRARDLSGERRDGRDDHPRARKTRLVWATHCRVAHFSARFLLDYFFH